VEIIDYSELRDRMVSNQLITRDITDKRVLEAMRKVHRHQFVSDDIRFKAYEDCALPIGEGQTISQPYMVAIMTELLELKGDEKVLEIGTGSGYQTAILAELSREVHSIERFTALSELAGQRLARMGYRNVHLTVGDGTRGLPDEAPFDRALVTAGAPSVPETIIQQMSDGAIAVTPVGNRFSQQLVKTVKLGGKLREERHTPCVFVPLVGKYGWERDD
jgi:protein-L-isoaspartate(D-aspartate) O-methyltransferase